MLLHLSTNIFPSIDNYHTTSHPQRGSQQRGAVVAYRFISIPPSVCNWRLMIGHLRHNKCLIENNIDIKHTSLSGYLGNQMGKLIDTQEKSPTTFQVKITYLRIHPVSLLIMDVYDDIFLRTDSVIPRNPCDQWNYSILLFTDKFQFQSKVFLSGMK